MATVDTERSGEDPPPTEVATPNTPPGGLEREVFGKWTVLLRNTFGALAVLTTCIAALANAYTTNASVSGKIGWPSETIMFIMNIGPVIIAWSFINTNKTLQTLLEGTSLTTKIREKVADIIAPKDKPE